MATTDRVKIAVVGLGMGLYHVECYSRNPNAELVAVCDLDSDYASSVARKFSVPTATSDYRELLDKDIDAVSVALPVWLHRPVTVEFLNAGKHVLVEKPMAGSLKEAVEMADAAKRAGKVLSVHHNRRHDPSTQYIKRVLANDALGRVYHVRTGWRRVSESMVRPLVESEGKVVNRGWFLEKSKGGGVLFDLGTHMLDRVMYLLDFPKVSRVMCSTHSELTKQVGEQYDAEDFASGMVCFDNGVSVQLEVSFATHMPDGGMYTEIYGSTGGISEHDSIRLVTNRFGGIETSSIRSLEEPKFATLVDDFVSSIVEDRSPLVTVEQSLAVVEVLEALRTSAEQVR